MYFKTATSSCYCHLVCAQDETRPVLCTYNLSQLVHTIIFSVLHYSAADRCRIIALLQHINRGWY